MLAKFNLSKNFAIQNMFIAILFLLLASQILSAPMHSISDNQPIENQTNSNITTRHFIFTQLFDDMKYLMHQPDFYGVVGGIAITPKLFNRGFDTEEPEFTELWGNSQVADNLFEMGEVIGDGKFPYALSAVSWGVGKLTHKESLQSFGADLFRAQTFNGFFVIGIKSTINRKRPNGGAYSYPSGHSSSAFATAGVIYKHFGKTYGIPAFLIAGYVGFSRLQENKHYLTDIIAGGILGSYFSLKLSHGQNKKDSIALSPFIQDNGNGLKLTIKL